MKLYIYKTMKNYKHTTNVYIYKYLFIEQLIANYIQSTNKLLCWSKEEILY